MTYAAFIDMVTSFTKALKQTGSLDAPHPWYNVLVPESIITEHLNMVIDTDLLTGEEPIITYPMRADLFQQPLFMKPSCETFYLVGVLYNTSFNARMDYPVESALARNKTMYDTVHAAGGTRYPVDAIPFTADDWKHHFGAKWELFCELKQKYDPNHLLGNDLFALKSTKAESAISL